MFVSRASFRFRFATCSVALLLAIGAVRSASGFVQTGSSWPFGTRIDMQLSLGPTAVTLQDGSATWNNCAAAALEIWNQHLEAVQFGAKQTSGTTGSGGDGLNTTFFSNTIFGESFDSRTLAVTVAWSDSATRKMTETDVIFNTANAYNSYRGPLQRSGSGYIFDFRRVAIHEFGHVLGLDHPDGQSLIAIMNSIVGDLDTVSADDIAGAKQLYRQVIRSSSHNAAVGFPVNTDIETNFTATDFSASGLPPGLAINSLTGQITGKPTTEGSFDPIVTAMGAFRRATATLSFFVGPPSITSRNASGSTPIGHPWSCQLTATNPPPATYAAQGLPPGLRVDPASGLISGIPTQLGHYQFTITVSSPGATARGSMFLDIVPPQVTVTSQPVRYVGAGVKISAQPSSEASLFSATGLPSGLTMDPNTGVISGVATLSGKFHIVVTAKTAYGTASGSFDLNISPSYDHAFNNKEQAASMTSDLARGRVYVFAPNFGVLVYDAKTLELIRQVRMTNYVWDLAISRDGTRLWAPSAKLGGGQDVHLTSIDLETFAVADGPSIGYDFGNIREGVGRRLYLTESQRVHQLDLATGAFADFGPSFYSTPLIEISPDGKTLYELTRNQLVSTLYRYDVSGPTPQLIESVTQNGAGTSLTVSHNGEFVIASSSAEGGAHDRTAVRSGHDLADIRGYLNLPPPNGSGLPIAFNTDDSQVFQPARDGSHVDVFDTATFQRVRQIPLPSTTIPYLMEVAPGDAYLFLQAGYLPLIAEPLTGAPQSSFPAHSLLNVSTRLTSGTGDKQLIAGFIVTGSAPKKVLLRAIGPSLNLAGKMADPQLELHDGAGKLIASNDNWNYNRAAILATGVAPDDERDAAIVATLNPGSYTAVLRGLANTTGVAVVEMYDLDAPHSRIANISTRGLVGLGDSAMIGGFIVGGDQRTSVLIRAIGPSLQLSGITGALQDTTLELRDANGAVTAQNDDWRSGQEQLISATGAAPVDSRESAIVATVAPGAYTAVVRGKNNTAGVGLVEVYNLTP